MNILNEFQSAGETYIKEFVMPDQSQKEELKKDWFKAFKFILSKAYYQGRDDELSKRYYSQAIIILENIFGDSPVNQIEILKELLRNNSIPKMEEWYEEDYNDNTIFVKLNNYQLINGKKTRITGKTRDLEMIIDILRIVSWIEKYDFNLVLWCLNNYNRIWEIFHSLCSVRQIAEKIASLILRDISFVYEIKLSNYYHYTYLFPIDTWINQIFVKLRIINNEDKYITKANKIVKVCLENNLDIRKVNAGAWYMSIKGKNEFVESLIT